MVTSSAVVGSSAISSRGPQASAIAIITRWRMPPDSSCGYCAHAPLGLGDAAPCAASRPRAPAPPARDMPRCSTSASAIWRPMVSTGLSEVIGSWKIIEIALPRTSRISGSDSSSRLRPSNSMRPPTMRRRRHRQQAQDRQRRHALAAAGLADDRQRLAGHHVEATPSTARTTPSRVWKCVFRSSTRSSGVALRAHRYMRRASRGSSASRRPSPSRLTDSTVSDRNRPGNSRMVRRDLDQASRLGHDVAPARDVRRRAGADERQDRLGDHRRGADVGRLHQQRRHGVRQDVAHQDRGQPRAGRRSPPRRTAARAASAPALRTRRTTRGTSAMRDGDDDVLEAGLASARSARSRAAPTGSTSGRPSRASRWRRASAG